MQCVNQQLNVAPVFVYLFLNAVFDKSYISIFLHPKHFWIMSIILGWGVGGYILIDLTSKCGYFKRKRKKKKQQSVSQIHDEEERIHNIFFSTVKWNVRSEWAIPEVAPSQPPISCVFSSSPSGDWLAGWRRGCRDIYDVRARSKGVVVLLKASLHSACFGCRRDIEGRAVPSRETEGHRDDSHTFPYYEVSCRQLQASPGAKAKGLLYVGFACAC